MTSPLVTGGFIALKSALNGKYVRYMPEHWEGKKMLKVSGEDAVSPYTRFQAEPSKEHDGYVHLRCCYNGKYWVAQQVGDEWCLFGDADEPEEDLSKPSCTLFRRGSEDDDSNDNKYELYHGSFKRNVYMLNDTYPTMKTLGSYCLLLGNIDRSNENAYMFSVIDLNKQMMLPKHVCFKGDNDRYGRVTGSNNFIEFSSDYIDDPAVFLTGGNNYIEFSADDIGDPAVRHTIYTNEDGTIRIKSDFLDRFWRRDPNWIKADSNDTTGDDPETFFRAVKIGDAFAFQSLGNNHYCKRLSTEDKDNCLNADVPTITKEALLRLEEPVLSRKIYGVEYHFNDAKIYRQKIITMATAQAVNRTSGQHKATLNLKYSETKERSWDSSVSVRHSVTTTIEAGVPGIVAGKIELQSEFTSSYDWGESDTRLEEHSIFYEIPVPTNTKLKLRVLATQGTCNVPFSYYQEDVLTSGEKIVFKFDDGIYRGVNSYDFTYEVTEEKLAEDISATGADPGLAKDSGHVRAEMRQNNLPHGSSRKISGRN